MSNEAQLLAVLAAGIAAYPAQLVFWNNTWRAHVDPELRVAAGPYSQVVVEVASADQLARVVSNCEQLNAVNGWTDGLVLLLPDDERVVKVEPVAAPKPAGDDTGNTESTPAPTPAPTAAPKPAGDDTGNTESTPAPTPAPTAAPKPAGKAGGTK